MGRVIHLSDYRPVACRECRTRPVASGGTFCRACTDWVNARIREHHVRKGRERNEWGLCAKCERPVDSGERVGIDPATGLVYHERCAP